ncbi:flavodoxin-dependent (E)-4-hydroxy-3-methylbut-2-enyl-diphosphate synthase [Campylobacter canadensis]|uniref:4-hydroxy-3-methylbut-2-en-1-yl diphosphate synthase (flavodoxin) n=1 Tax=Campylobacter canadensis TaxID=449520 RepID=A0ABS7WSG9_9BACT|nr:flavodoxin-dependent (E)-4-hydroxy-3-methylbut-2-enyl-diphosphate synthase [Campylobacter canadensis]MBZ7987716.1 flavodoxin-dependent (E)-4-hydroxy-3-methylbut-2-enyl-diphosphate synthase [Campylobacter canadensis]MBZ7994123.1 flavodoxin-dependent (E)-4-hydroxy-3-methylbut-2-enyl-diphosphate synthase [Campylobacter canadensis]MBZ7995874.1 flavodoxin-dependent (E)-4-hydroxy-3-methylbut-2-enyl-diphosphate synthase [Campylobacter canadensis]MBZ7997511.1 flavodoxin-dependent (E)-4-hydroxy-3-met
MSEYKRFKTKQISVGGVKIGGDAPISVQSMLFTKTQDIQGCLEQLMQLKFAGADIVRLACLDIKDARALRQIKEQSPLPLIVDIHFNHNLALYCAEFIDGIRINPGNIGGKENIKAVVDACKQRKIPIRIGVNHGSLEKQFEIKHGRSVEALIQSALYNIKLLEDLDYTEIKISIKTSDVQSTIEAYTKLRNLCEYPFHLGVTEAGTKFHSTIKSSIALGNLLLNGIGDTLRVSMTGELCEEIKVAKAILQDSGVQKSGVNIISCPTCGRIQSDLLSAIKIVEEKTKDIKAPLNISVMGCAVNALGEAKGADVAIAFGKNEGLVIKRGEIVAKCKYDKLVDRFLEEVKIEAALWENK